MVFVPDPDIIYPSEQEILKEQADNGGFLRVTGCGEDRRGVWYRVNCLSYDVAKADLRGREVSDDE